MNKLIFSILFTFSLSFASYSQESISYSDTSLRIVSISTYENSWVILSSKDTISFYPNVYELGDNLNKYTWQIPINKKEFSNKIWLDKDNVYTANKKNVEIFKNSNGEKTATIPFANVVSKPELKNNYYYFTAIVKGKYTLVCYNPKKKKAVWNFPVLEGTNSLIFTEDFIITKDSTNFPIALKYVNGKNTFPRKLEKGNNPYTVWNEMFSVHGNDPYDELFEANGKLYAINYYNGFLAEYDKEEYPIPNFRLDLNAFTQKNEFKLNTTTMGLVLFNNQGFQYLRYTELDSLRKMAKTDGFGIRILMVPFSKSQYFKIKSTTIMGNFSDFASAQVLDILDNKILLFENNGQVIGINPINGRTYNFQNIYESPSRYSIVNGNMVYYGFNERNLLKVKLERILTDEEKEQLLPPVEYREMFQQKGTN